MRTTAMLAALLCLCAGPPGFAQIRADPGTVGPRAVPRTPDQSSNPGTAANSSIPAGQARGDKAANVPNAIPADEARAMMQSKCGGPVADLGLDGQSTWHAKCHKDGRDQAMSLGSDGNVQMQ